MSGSTTVRTPDGRALEVGVSGPRDGEVLVFHHGTPGSALPPPGLVEAARARGMRTVAHARPGYGGSSPQPGRRVADVAADTALVLDSLGVERFWSLGWSGGGPHALACGALLPDRCRAVGSAAGVAPYERLGSTWTDGMGESNVAEFGAALGGREDLELFLSGIDRSDVTAEELLAQISSLFPPVDVEAWRAGIGEYHLAGSRDGVRLGIDGWRDDDLAFVTTWGFEPGDIDVPVTIWHGQQDRAVPFSHGRWLADNIPRARRMLSVSDGHLSLMARPDRLLEELL